MHDRDRHMAEVAPLLTDTENVEVHSGLDIKLFHVHQFRRATALPEGAGGR